MMGYYGDHTLRRVSRRTASALSCNTFIVTRHEKHQLFGHNVISEESVISANVTKTLRVYTHLELYGDKWIHCVSVSVGEIDVQFPRLPRSALGREDVRAILEEL
jgi:hypothetical protein